MCVWQSSRCRLAGLGPRDMVLHHEEADVRRRRRRLVLYCSLTNGRSHTHTHTLTGDGWLLCYQWKRKDHPNADYAASKLRKLNIQHMYIARCIMVLRVCTHCCTMDGLV